jgi:hypothetical protein
VQIVGMENGKRPGFRSPATEPSSSDSASRHRV